MMHPPLSRTLLPLSMMLPLLCAAMCACGAAPDGRASPSDGPAMPTTNDGATANDQSDSKSDDTPTAVRPFEDIVVYPDHRRVEIRSWTCLEAGYLEQVACSPATREHESLLVIRAKPSNIHAALLMAGFESGAPGRWEFDPDTRDVTHIQPRGDMIDVWLAYEKDGKRIVESARAWIRDHHEKQTFPNTPWVFGGSMFRPNPEWIGPGEHYVADITGSIIGLVTFGDETIGLREVISDQAEIHEPEWVVNTERVPPEGTEVTVILLPFGEEPELANVTSGGQTQPETEVDPAAEQDAAPHSDAPKGGEED